MSLLFPNKVCWKRGFILRAVLGIILPASFCGGETDTILILHTNDMHDHVRPDYDGQGGIPYVSGYIKSVKTERRDVIVLDAGDVAEKGDMVAFKTGSEMVYEAMARIGYAAGAPGNHDHDFGISQLHRFESLAGGMKLLCLNLIKEDGTPEFPPSAIFDVDGVKVGIIGLIVPRKKNCLNLEESGVAMAREAERLEEKADLIVALCHLGSKNCRKLSLAAPLVDVFVAGHKHEVLRKAQRVKETGALIVQAGSYAEYVGRLELTLNLDTEKIIRARSKLVPMRHDRIPVDEEMLAWVEENEEAISPEASRIVSRSDVPIERAAIGWLAAAALRKRSDAEIAFCHAGQVIRAGLPKGPMDVNALFRTGGQRGYRIVETRLTGAQIEAYLTGLHYTDWGQTQWSGFRARLESTASRRRVYRTDLEPDRLYRVALPELEWETRYLRLLERQAEGGEKADSFSGAKATVALLPFSFTDALTEYVEALPQEGLSLKKNAKRLQREQTRRSEI